MAASELPQKPAAHRSLADRFFSLACRFSALGVLGLVGLLLLVLMVQSWPAIREMGRLELLTSTHWAPPRSFGALSFLYGTIVTSAIAMGIAVPLGVGAATYLAEIAPNRIRKASAFLLELLAAIPSVVYGFWAKAFLARAIVLPVMEALDMPGLEAGLGGQSLLSAGLVLAIMILPYITALTFDVCRAVPRSQREVALALGSTRWQMIRLVVWPAARAGIVAACLLALGRALGETMAVTMVVGNADYFHWSPAAPGDTIPSIIAKLLHESSSGGKERSVLISLSFLLLAVTVASHLAARVLVRWSARPKMTSLREVPILLGEQLSAPVPPSQQQIRNHRRFAKFVDKVMTVCLASCQILTVIPLFLVLSFVAYRGAGEVNWAFFTELPPGLQADRQGGLGQAVLGSLMLVAMATVMVVPIGVLTALFLNEYKLSRLCGPVRTTIEMLSGIPSVVIGVFIYSLLVYPFWLPKVTFGFSAWAGACALAVIMLPVIVRTTEEALALVPGSLREASYALGATRWSTVRRVLIPSAMPAILTGILLAVGRAAGETAPLILTAGTSNFWPSSPNQATPSVPYFVHEYSKQIGMPEYERLGWAAAFVLLAAVLLTNLLTRALSGKRTVLTST